MIMFWLCRVLYLLYLPYLYLRIYVSPYVMELPLKKGLTTSIGRSLAEIEYTEMDSSTRLDMICTDYRHLCTLVHFGNRCHVSMCGKNGGVFSS